MPSWRAGRRTWRPAHDDFILARTRAAQIPARVAHVSLECQRRPLAIQRHEHSSPHLLEIFRVLPYFTSIVWQSSAARWHGSSDQSNV